MYLANILIFIIFCNLIDLNVARGYENDVNSPNTQHGSRFYKKSENEPRYVKQNSKNDETKVPASPLLFPRGFQKKRSYIEKLKDLEVGPELEKVNKKSQVKVSEITPFQHNNPVNQANKVPEYIEEKYVALDGYDLKYDPELNKNLNHDEGEMKKFLKVHKREILKLIKENNLNKVVTVTESQSAKPFRTNAKPVKKVPINYLVNKNRGFRSISNAKRFIIRENQYDSKFIKNENRRKYAYEENPANSLKKSNENAYKYMQFLKQNGIRSGSQFMKGMRHRVYRKYAPLIQIPYKMPETKPNRYFKKKYYYNLPKNMIRVWRKDLKKYNHDLPKNVVNAWRSYLKKHNYNLPKIKKNEETKRNFYKLPISYRTLEEPPKKNNIAFDKNGDNFTAFISSETENSVDDIAIERKMNDVQKTTEKSSRLKMAEDDRKLPYHNSDDAIARQLNNEKKSFLHINPVNIIVTTKPGFESNADVKNNASNAILDLKTTPSVREINKNRNNLATSRNSVNYIDDAFDESDEEYYDFESRPHDLKSHDSSALLKRYEKKSPTTASFDSSGKDRKSEIKPINRAELNESTSLSKLSSLSNFTKSMRGKENDDQTDVKEKKRVDSFPKNIRKKMIIETDYLADGETPLYDSKTILNDKKQHIRSSTNNITESSNTTNKDLIYKEENVSKIENRVDVYSKVEVLTTTRKPEISLIDDDNQTIINNSKSSIRTKNDDAAYDSAHNKKNNLKNNKIARKESSKFSKQLDNQVKVQAENAHGNYARKKAVFKTSVHYNEGKVITEEMLKTTHPYKQVTSKIIKSLISRKNKYRKPKSKNKKLHKFENDFDAIKSTMSTSIHRVTSSEYETTSSSPEFENGEDHSKDITSSYYDSSLPSEIAAISNLTKNRRMNGNTDSKSRQITRSEFETMATYTGSNKKPFTDIWTTESSKIDLDTTNFGEMNSDYYDVHTINNILINDLGLTTIKQEKSADSIDAKRQKIKKLKKILNFLRLKKMIAEVSNEENPGTIRYKRRILSYDSKVNHTMSDTEMDHTNVWKGFIGIFIVCLIVILIIFAVRLLFFITEHLRIRKKSISEECEEVLFDRGIMFSALTKKDEESGRLYSLLVMREDEEDVWNTYV